RDEPVCRCDHDIEPALLEGDAGCDFELHRDQEMLCAGVLREGKGRVKVSIKTSEKCWEKKRLRISNLHKIKLRID
ncbi:MAG TPA: hypothetical protein PKZ65_01905, partial [Methanoregulaceae archaeon]|nr:hypothetical protein [Methanoregulaceae archaeon]